MCSWKPKHILVILVKNSKDNVIFSILQFDLVWSNTQKGAEFKSSVFAPIFDGQEAGTHWQSSLSVIYCKSVI